MRQIQRKDKYGHVQSNALHGKENNLPVPEMETNLATICLDLFESIEGKIDRNKVKIKCVPSDDAFDRKIVLGGHIFQAIEILLLEILSKFSVIDQEVMLSTRENYITVSGINTSLGYFDELCSERDGKLIIEINDKALALAYLKLNGSYIREDIKEGRNMVLIGFGT